MLFWDFVILLLRHVFVEPMETGRCGENSICCFLYTQGYRLEILTDFIWYVGLFHEFRKIQDDVKA